MREWIVTYALGAADPDNIATAQALGGAGDVVLDGVAVVDGVAVLDTQRRIGITSVGDDTGVIFTVYGTDGSGTVISEEVVGANAGLAQTLRDFKTVTRVSGDGATVGNITVGTTDTGSSIPILADTWFQAQYIGIQGKVTDGVGGVTWTIETTIESLFPKLPIYVPGYDQTPPMLTWVPWPTLMGQAGVAQSSINGTAIQAWRVVLVGVGAVEVVGRQQGPW